MTVGLRAMGLMKITRSLRRRINERNVSDDLLADIEEKSRRIPLNIDTNMLKIGFVGGGKMAQALAKGFINAGLSKGEMITASCLPSDKGSINAFKEIGSKTVFTNNAVAEQSDVLILSVKPQVIPRVLPDIQDPSKLILSIAMGISISSLEKGLPNGTPVIRVMPNTPALVGCGATVFSRGTHADEEAAEVTEKLFSSIGICQEVDENLIDPVTALAGSGPAYVYMMIESMADGAVKMGMPRQLAIKLAAQTIIGGGMMVRETGIHPGQLKDDVASPGGSTIAAIHHLEKNGLRNSLIGAIEVATQRCKEFNTNK